MGPDVNDARSDQFVRASALVLVVSTLAIGYSLADGSIGVAQLSVAALLHAGLWWAPSASRGPIAQRLLAVVLMAPSALIFLGMSGEAVTKVLRGHSPHPVWTAITLFGTTVYAWQLFRLAKGAGRLPTRTSG